MNAHRRLSGKAWVVAAILAAAVFYFPVRSGAQGAAAGPRQRSAEQKAMPASSEDLVRLSAGRMIVEIDKRNGCLYSIREKEGKFGTNYIGSTENVPGSSPADPVWTGNVVSTVWELAQPPRPLVFIPSFSFRPSGQWRRESTGRSADIRKVSFDGTKLAVDYVGRSANEGGLRSYDLRTSYRLAEDNSLLWDLEIENTTADVLEIGELGFPLSINDNYSSVRAKSPYTNTADDYNVLDEDERLKVGEQKIIHEQKVVGHNFVGGHSSYSLIERLLGDSPYLLVHPTQNTSFECIYRFDDQPQGGQGGRRGGRANVLSIYSLAVKNRSGWRTPWVNGHSSIVLKPGEKKSYELRFAFIDRYSEIGEQLSKWGNLGVRILPSMVVPEDSPVYVEIRSQSDPAVEFLSDQIKVVDKKRLADRTLLTLSFKGRGQKTVRLTYGGTRWTNLHFYCTEDTEQLIKARARFIVQRQFYENPSDPWHRNHMFLPFDYRLGSVFRDADEVWEVGGNDEYGFSEPLFLAEKNELFPDRDEIAALEAYVNDCLYKYIQDPQTFALRASLYWKERTPSSPWGHWNEARSKETYRTFNYPHAANVYHALYRIGKNFGLTSRRKPLEYLDLAYQTSVKQLNTGPWKHVGVMGGSNAVNILEDLKAEGMTKEYDRLLAEMKACDDAFVQIPYPYSSELFVDQTAHEHVYGFTRYFKDIEKNRKTLQVIQALKGGNQPVWFRYGNDARGDQSCWYTTSLNGWALLQGFEDTSDRDMLIKGYAGIMNVTANLLADGMGFGNFSTTPGSFGHENQKTSDGGIGMYGFLKAAKAYVIKDESFGLIGCGCRVQESGGKIQVSPRDGLRKRVLFVEDKVDLKSSAGDFDTINYDSRTKSLELHMSDSTKCVAAAEVEVKGLAPGAYRVSHGAARETMTNSGVLKIKVPMSDAGLIKIERTGNN